MANEQPPADDRLQLTVIEAQREDVWVIAATNRPDMLDDALLRPGRLDYRLEVPKPDQEGREVILAVRLRGKPVADGVELASLAERTAGMSAAETRFMCDRAAMNALRRVFPDTAARSVETAGLQIEQADFDDALGASRQ